MTDACYCAALRGASRKVTSIYDAALAPIGVTLAQFSLLRTIKREGQLSLTDLGRLVDLDRSTIGRNIKVMRRQGFVTTTSGTDHREARVALDASGLDVLRRGAPLWDQAQDGIRTKLGPDAVHNLLALLQAL